MKIALVILTTACCLCVTPGLALAHQPRLVSGNQTVRIKNPELSQAFYAELEGSSHEYQIVSDIEFNFYINILVPDLPGLRKDFIVKVYNNNLGNKGTIIKTIDGTQQDWKIFYEPFVADRYYMGPEVEAKYPAGSYKITVSNPENEGKYVLAVGKKESFTLKETVQTIKSLPSVKRYFNKSPFTAFFNLIGAFIIMSILILTAAIYLFYKFIILRIIK